LKAEFMSSQVKVWETKDRDPKSVVLHFQGSLDGSLDMSAIRVDPTKKLVLDVAGINLIDSVGTRGWVKWIMGLPSELEITLENCPGAFIEQVNMIQGFLPKQATIESFFVPYYCETCKIVSTKLMSVGEIGKQKKVSEYVPCETCGDVTEIDVTPETYFKFVSKYTKK